MMLPESNDLSAAVTVCARGSLFFHSTVLPTVISMRVWRYVMLRIPVRTTRATGLLGTRDGVGSLGGRTTGFSGVGAARATVSVAGGVGRATVSARTEST